MAAARTLNAVVDGRNCQQLLLGAQRQRHRRLIQLDIPQLRHRGEGSRTGALSGHQRAPQGGSGGGSGGKGTASSAR